MAFLCDNWRPRRSMLFVPAANRKAVAKAHSLSCDGLIFDLEDSVAPGERPKAYANLRSLARAESRRRECAVRISGCRTPQFGEDLAVAVAIGPDAIVLPKVESAEDLQQARIGMGRADAALWAMIETPMGLLALPEIARCGVQLGLQVLVVGSNDLAKTTGVKLRPGRAALVPWLVQVVAAGRAFRLGVLDGVCNDFRDTARFGAECEQGASLGFDGKTLIHPAQIEAANRAFSPGADDLDWARAVVAAFGKAENSGRGAIQIDGEMVERLHLTMAERLVNLAETLDCEER